MQRAGHAGWALMNAIHDALRRDLDELLRTTASRMAARARWIMFRDQLRFYLAAEQAAILGDQATMMVCVPSLLSWRPPNLVIEETVDADLEASRPP